MGPIEQGALAGLIAGLAVTVVLGVARYIHQKWGNRKDVEYIRDLLTQGMRRVMEAENTFHPGMKVCIPADALRAAQYKYLMKQVGIGLERWAVHLSHNQRKDIYDALDWYNLDGLHATKKDGQVVFPEIPEGRWPTTEMSIKEASRKFERLHSIKWLKLESD